MAFSVTMPALGESVSEGTVTRWLKQEGDTVALDEPLLEVSTDKVDTEIPSPAAGVLQRIVVTEDQTVAVGAELALIGDGADSGEAAPAQTDAPAASVPSAASVPDTHASPSAPTQAAVQPSSGETPPAPSEPSPPAAGDDAPNGTPVVLPALGESVSEGTVTRWLKAVGDSVEVDEPLLEVSTDKVDTELPSPVAGTLLRIDVEADATVSVGAQLGLIGQASGSVPSAPAAPTPPPAAAPAPAAAAPAATPAPSPPSAPTTAPVIPATPGPSAAFTPPAAPAPSSNGTAPSNDSAAYVTPLVRRLAADSGVDLSSLSGTGVGGRIRKQDVLDAAAARQRPEPAAPAASGATPSRPATTVAPAPQRGTREKMSRLRKVIAERMVDSLKVSAQLTTVVEVDLTAVASLRARAKREFEAREGVKLSFLPFLAKATVEALTAHASVNASIVGDEIVYHDSEHLGIAVDTERGLLVPVLKDAGDLNIAGLARRIADIAERTRTNKITPDELGGGTFTLTNTGSRGALFDTPIINQPQVGILGTGAVVKRPVVVPGELGDSIAIRSMMYLALSYDHRLVDGADAARFLTTIKTRLEEGAFTGDLGL